MLNLFFNAENLALFAALVLPFLLSLILGPRLIATLRAMKAGQPIRQASLNINAPDHQNKVGTPTMGGIMIVALILLNIILFSRLDNPLILSCTITLSITAALGFLDDYAKITRNNSDGLGGWTKIAIQVFAALLSSCYFYWQSPDAGLLNIPFMGSVNIGLFFIPLAIVTIVAGSNAVNITDGIDGLASGCITITAVAFIFIFRDIQSSIILLSIISACLGFLWFICNPAKIFMGDTGSLSLGALLSTLAVCSHSALSFLIVGLIFVLEALSVIVQVGYFKYSKRKYGQGRRLLRMAPLHHHFEKKGWSETQVCTRFWIVAALFGVIGALAA